MSADHDLNTQDTPSLSHWDAADLPVDWRAHMGERGLLVVIIHGTWCHACLERLVWLRRQQGWLKEQGIGILSVSADDPGQVEAFHQSLWSPLPFALIADPNADLSRALGLYDETSGAARAALVLLDCDGRVRHSQLDEHDGSAAFHLQEHIERLPARR